MTFIKNYGLPILEAIATLAIAVLTVLLGVWLTEELSAQSGNLVELALACIWSSKFDASSPVPWLGASLVVSLIGRIEGLINRYWLGQLTTANAKLAQKDGEHRQEAQDHAETKGSYFETLGNALMFLLTTDATGFNRDCRITIYRKQHDDDDQYLKQIFRHSPTMAFEKNGRFRIPADQGVVGAAWRNHGVKEFECDLDPTSEEFIAKMNECLEKEGCEHPTGPLSMPTRHYYARAFRDNESGQRIGIVVYECVEVGVLNVAGIDQVLDGQMLDVTRLIRHRGILDQEFNPDPVED